MPTKKECNSLMISEKLKQEVLIIHGEINQKQREASIEAFKKGKVNCLVATDVAARGLDIPMVDLVIQSEPPKDVDSYIHRAGRTARAGRTGTCITLFTKMTESLLYRIESKAKIKFKKIGAPQRMDIINASFRDIKSNIKNIHDTSIDVFRNEAKSLLEDYSAEEAISRLLAYVSGQTEEMKSRSVLCGAEGFVTYKIETDSTFYNNNLVWSALRRIIPQSILSNVRGMRLYKNSKGAVFDVPEEKTAEFELAIKTDKVLQSIFISRCDQLPELASDDRNGFARNESKRLDVFVGNLPYGCDEGKIMDLLKANHIDPKGVDIRIVRDRESGNNKGFCFLTVWDESIFTKIMTMKNRSINGRILKIDDSNSKGRSSTSNYRN